MTVVVGVDGSARSRTALRLAAQEARWRRTPLVAVGAYELPLSTPAGGYPAAKLHTRAEERATTESELRDAVADELGNEAEQTEVRVSPGLAGHVIIEAARETQAELIVLASHAGKAVLPGTVSYYVLLKARCPVTVVPADGADVPNPPAAADADTAGQHEEGPA
jgi:nucleotide-binding universal stress UspA family protein